MKYKTPNKGLLSIAFKLNNFIQLVCVGRGKVFVWVMVPHLEKPFASRLKKMVAFHIFMPFVFYPRKVLDFHMRLQKIRYRYIYWFYLSALLEWYRNIHICIIEFYQQMYLIWLDAWNITFIQPMFLLKTNMIIIEMLDLHLDKDKKQLFSAKWHFFFLFPLSYSVCWAWITKAI